MNQQTLLRMLRYRRPARSKTEQEFIRKYLDSIPGMYADQYGNRILQCPDSRVMISTHTDTVHRMEGLQRVGVQGCIAQLHPKELVSNCLGADDTAGIYIALRMIQAGVKATYVFHRDEEIGGRGSAWLADKYPEWLEAFDVCLALDRRGTSDIITSQWMGECASPEFAATLSESLGLGHSEAQGSFTDSANYAHLIPECSNLSIGYQCEHSREETLNLGYLEGIAERLIHVDWARLAIVRTPMDEDAADTWEFDYAHAIDCGVWDEEECTCKVDYCSLRFR